MTDMKNTEKQKWVLLDASSYMQRLLNKKGEKSKVNLPTSQYAPVKPGLHLHLYRRSGCI